MSYTLIMRLAGPMQSWGVSSRFGIRETLPEPSKSGVIGLLCAALGWDREAETHFIAGHRRTLVDLAGLRFGVRVVREGILRRDYHTAQNVLRAKANLRPGRPTSATDLQQTVLSERYYLSDAWFLVGFESTDESLLQALDSALQNPHWPLSLGRKSFVPTCPVRYTTGETPGVVNLPLAEALLTARDLLLTDKPDRRTADFAVKPVPANARTLRFVADPGDEAYLSEANLVLTQQAQRTDVPLSFAPRRFAPRDVITYTCSSKPIH